MSANPDASGDQAFVDLVTDEAPTTPHSLTDAPLKVRVAIVGVLTLITALFWGFGAWALFPDAAHWSFANFGRLTFLLAGVAMIVLAIRGNSAGEHDAAARGAHFLLGLGWILFVWSVIGLLGRSVLSGLSLHPEAAARLTSLGVAAVVTLLAIFGYAAARRVPALRHTTVPIKNLSRPLTVAVLTDTHFDAWTTPQWASRVVERVNSTSPDIVVHAGDLADGSVAQRSAQVQWLADVQAGTRAYIAGNHEYYSDAPAWMKYMDQLGWSVLINQHLVHEQTLVVAGLDDPTGTAMAGRGPSVDQALASAPSLPILLLAHQPHQVKDALERVDLQISGHTHGGQIWPFHYLVKLREPVVQGLATVSPRTRLYVSRGSGFWGPPFRVFAPSEISVLHLVPA